MNVTRVTSKAFIGSVILLLVAGGLHRWAHLSRASMMSRFRPPVVPLSELPSQLGTYFLERNLALSVDILEVARVDSYIFRDYVDRSTGESVQLYCGYWGRENVGMGHGPEVCFPLAGWEAQMEPQQRLLRLSGGTHRATEVVTTIHHFARTEPEGVERLAVGFVAVFDGEFRTSSRGVFQHRPPHTSDTGFLAHIELITPVMPGAWEAADTRLSTFMEALLPHVSRCLFDSRAHEDDSAETVKGGPHDG